VTKGVSQKCRVIELLQPISKKKYPAITEEEEAISLPLQTLCQAIFDCTLVHMMNTVAPGVWIPLKSELCDKLVRTKVARTVDILKTQYADNSVIFLQEVAAAFVAEASVLADTHIIVTPAKLDGKRDQNSLILLRKDRFQADSVTEVTAQVLGELDVGVQDGDLLAITCTATDGERFLFGSFHGDTQGLQTIPVMGALHAAATEVFSEHTFMYGIDGNAHYEADGGKKLSCADFVEWFKPLGMGSAFGEGVEQGGYTTYNARTYLQSQLNKACKSTEIRATGDVNPKDFILFKKDQYEVVSTAKDNTGDKTFVEDIVFPTLHFPSDHCVTYTTLHATTPASL